MAAKINGRLAAADLAATTLTTIYSPPVGRKATVSINVCNRTAAPISVRVAHCATPTVAGVTIADYQEYDTVVLANNVLLITGEPVASGNCIGAYAAAVGVSVVLYGIEEDI